MLLEKPYLQQINLGEDSKFGKSLIFRSFAVVLKEPHPFSQQMAHLHQCESQQIQGVSHLSNGNSG